MISLTILLVLSWTFQVYGEYVLLFGDSLDRIALFQHCDSHGSVQGGAVTLSNWQRSIPVSNEVVTHCLTRDGDIIAFIHLFGSSLKGPYFQGSYYHKGIRKEDFDTEVRLQEGIEEFHKRYQTLPDRILFHTTSLDASSNAIFPPFPSSSRRKAVTAIISSAVGVAAIATAAKSNKPSTSKTSVEPMDPHTWQTLENEGLEKFRNNTLHWMQTFSKLLTQVGEREKTTRKTQTKFILRASPAPVDDDLPLSFAVQSGAAANESIHIKGGIGHRIARMNAILQELVASQSLSDSISNWHYYDLDSDLWSLHSSDTDKKSRGDERLFFDHFHPAKLFLSRYIEKILGLRYSSFMHSPSYPSSSVTPFFPRIDLCSSSTVSPSSSSSVSSSSGNSDGESVMPQRSPVRHRFHHVTAPLPMVPPYDDLLVFDNQEEAPSVSLPKLEDIVLHCGRIQINLVSLSEREGEEQLYFAASSSHRPNASTPARFLWQGVDKMWIHTQLLSLKGDVYHIPQAQSILLLEKARVNAALVQTTLSSSISHSYPLSLSPMTKFLKDSERDRVKEKTVRVLDSTGQHCYLLME